MLQLAEQASYEEMAEFRRLAGETREEFSMEERNLHSVAYENAVGSRRASGRTVSSVGQKETSKNNAENAALVSSHHTTEDGELNKICVELLKPLKDSLITTRCRVTTTGTPRSTPPPTRRWGRQRMPTRPTAR